MLFWKSFEDFPLFSDEKKRALCAGWGGGGEVLLNQTIVSEVAPLNLDFLLCDDSLQRHFKLEVDASEVGAGAVLLQEDADGVDHPVCFFSRKFNKHHVNYSTIEKET